MAVHFLLNFSASSSLLLLIVTIFVSSSISSLSQTSSHDAREYSSRSLKKVHYGSACNSTVRCDIHSLLTCEDNICQCLYQDAMVYSAEIGTCVAVVNEVCGFLETKKVFINCVPDSLCDQHQGVCKCVQGYVESERGCVRQKDFGESCHSDAECLADLSLICFEEICQCDPEQYVPFYAAQNDIVSPAAFSTNDVKCVALAGLPCTAKSGCVLKASCVSSTDNDGGGGGGMRLSSAYSWMHPGVCQCDFGYEADGNGYCRGKYGASCDVLANVTCSEGFHCLNGICHCKYPDDQIYSGEVDKCVSLAGGPCSYHLSEKSQGREKEAVGNVDDTASCGKFLECRSGSCACKQGFVENKERGCDLAYGQPCTGLTMDKCDIAAGLYCINGKCACKDDIKIFDAAVGKCLGKVGSSCAVSKSEDHIIPHSEFTILTNTNHGKVILNTDTDCGENTTCYEARSQLKGLTVRGVCTLQLENNATETSRPSDIVNRR